MRHAWIVVAVVAVVANACKGHATASAPPPTRSDVMVPAPFDACAVARQHLASMTCKSAKMIDSAIVELAGTDEATRRKSNIQCAWTLHVMSSSPAPPG